MAETRIDQLREILARAAARDEALRSAMNAFAADLMKELGDDRPPVWAGLEAAKGERQLDPYFVLQQHEWLRGDLVIEVTPDAKYVIGLRMCMTKDGTHDVGLVKEASHSAIIDAPDEKERAATRKKLYDRIFAGIESEVRQSVAFPTG